MDNWAARETTARFATIRAWLACALAVLSCGVPAAPARAAMGDEHGLVLRGRVLAASGAPGGGAVVSTRGAYVVSSVADDRGRYTLNIPLGTAAGLRHGAFALEVRAEQGGHRLPLAAGAPALGIELSLLQSGTTVRVKSNLQDATTALATAFAQEGASTAWVDADFGGAAKATGSMELRVIDDVDASGRHAARGVPVIPTPVAPAVRESVRPAAPAPVPAPAPVTRTDTLAPAPARADFGGPAPAAARPAQRRRRRRPSAPAVARADAAAPAAPLAPIAAALAPVVPPVAAAPVSAPEPQVARNVPDAAPIKPTQAVALPERAPFDTCACRVQGTVEIDWETPLERNFPIELTLTGPATQTCEVEMFMGSPREFHLGPLPCGEYRLSVHPHGKRRYAFARWGAEMKVHCAGATQLHVVLVPR